MVQRRRSEANVAWSTISFPSHKGGLGIIDPAIQSKALLGKLIVCRLLPGGEPSKSFLLTRISSRNPRLGGPQPQDGSLLWGGYVESMLSRTDLQLASLGLTCL